MALASPNFLDVGLRDSRVHLFRFRRSAHAPAIPTLKIGTSNEPLPVGVLVGGYTLSQDQSKNCGRMHLELPDCFACGENFHFAVPPLLLVQHMDAHVERWRKLGEVYFMDETRLVLYGVGFVIPIRAVSAKRDSYFDLRVARAR
jgi:hypothetical protein